jgi:hypothetical protein
MKGMGIGPYTKEASRAMKGTGFSPYIKEAK